MRPRPELHRSAHHPHPLDAGRVLLYIANRVVQLVIRQDVSAETFDRLVALAVNQRETVGDVGFLNLCTVLFTVIKNNPRRLAMATTMFNIVRLVMLDELCEDVIDTLFNALLSVIDGDLLKELLPLEAFQTTVSLVPARSPPTDRPAADRHRLRLLHADSPQDTQPIRDIIAMLFTTHNAVQLASYFRMSRVVNVARYNA